ncbi:DUF2793 domain-containing protein [Rhodobacteraceae bacterium KMM 6894]|nr:DUF2793 domain-containing protein [Rhodobacteraceae bacterium KMM 6894]
MSDTSPRLGLPYIQPSQAQKHVTHNEALQRLDALVQLSVVALGVETPPGSPDAGDLYGIGADPVGVWAGQGGMLAYWDGAAWLHTAPQTGWQAWDTAANARFVYHGGGWQADVPVLDNLDGVGINAAADGVNRLALASDTSLFSHDGAGHQIKVNKATTGDTAALLFQSNWSGRAEMGLTGQDDFTVKVSDDGSVWTDALRIDGGTGHISGAAVVASEDDTTEGRIMVNGTHGLGNASMRLDDADGAGGRTTFFALQSGSSHAPSSASTWMGVNFYRGYSNTDAQLMVRASDPPEAVIRGHSGSAFTEWAAMYHTANTVGTVSESGGVPNGAIIEQGSNADGHYVRFADGTQIAWVHDLDGDASGVVTWDFPADFATAPTVTATALSTLARIVTVSGIDTTSVDVRGWLANGTAEDVTTQVTATGRWF